MSSEFNDHDSSAGVDHLKSLGIDETTVLPIHETFQNTVQGEGFWTGRTADFIRLAGCPVGCSWCDTGYAASMPVPSFVRRSVAALLSELQSPFIVITGGEPYIHRNLPQLCQAIINTNRSVAIETSGIRSLPIPDAAWVTLSPKAHLNLRADVDSAMWERANEIKLVVKDAADFWYYHETLEYYCSSKPVFLQPEWNSLPGSLSCVFALLKEHPTYRLSVQLHKYLGVP